MTHLTKDRSNWCPQHHSALRLNAAMLLIPTSGHHTGGHTMRSLSQKVQAVDNRLCAELVKDGMNND
ncbi:hypothetical protein S2091_1389 [Solimicrobium silvestre]|uniref:Uncharacterized protein n=1 Tax=Solimicrobium silvestre TaxID=2099400 RepID=A0A2S9H1F5_9BURK|nr:hypothetical protein S2091_1389 [Solimicrobium silvestre]